MRATESHAMSQSKVSGYAYTMVYVGMEWVCFG
jgi:hypothetical protein